MMIRSKLHIALTAALSLTLVSPSLLSADEGKIKFKIATIAPDGTPWAVLLNGFKKKVMKGSGKVLAPRVYLNGLKGDEQSIVRQVHKGSLQMGGVSTGALSTIVPDMDILELPYAFPDFETADRVLDSVRPTVEAILNEKGLTLLMYSENGYRSFATKDKCIQSPADLKAMKMRSQESEVHVETYRALGASPVTISVGEVLSSLQTGVVNGFDNTPIITQALGWNQAIKFFSNTRHIYQPALIIMNKAWFDSLSEEHQKLMRETAMKMEKRGRKMVRKLEPALMQNFAQQEVKVCDLTPAQIAAFKAATASVWEVRAKKASPLGKKLIEAMKAK
jgi:TRAP-type C4-dicarboxylate transport system substrate-binding protein